MHFLRSFHLEKLRALGRTFPAVAILGPRQAGKSTLVRDHLGSLPARAARAAFDLERPSDLRRLSASPEEDLGLLQTTAAVIAIDEAQRLPSLFPLLRVLLDAPGRKARYLITGSASPSLVAAISESLAGRVAFLDLPPLLAEEVAAAPITMRERLWIRGGFPPSLLARSERDSRAWRDAYLRALVEQDIPALGLRLPAALLLRLWTMVAHLHGGILNQSELAASLSVSVPTIARYLDVLAGTFMIRRLPPYWANVGKRLVKAPKVYVRDSGLLHALLLLDDAGAVRSHPKVGASWEGFVIEQLLGALSLAGESPRGFYWRTHGGAEVDLLVELGDRLIPIEVKLGGEPEVGRGLVECMKDLQLPAGFVVHGGADAYPLRKDVRALPASLLADPRALRRELLGDRRTTPAARRGS